MDTSLLQLLVLLGWPLALGTAVTWLTWGALRRPLAFFLVSCAVLYVVYAFAHFLFGPNSVGFSLSVRQPGEPLVETEAFVLLRPYAGPLLAFTVAAIPIIVLLLRAFKRREADRDEV